MHSSTIIIALLGAYCTATSNSADPPAGAKTTFLTLTKSCSTTGTLAAVATYTVIPTPVAAECTCAAPLPTSIPESPIPRIPVKEEEVKAFDSLLSLLLSVPDNILSSTDQAISTFYTNLSSCIDSKGAKLAQSFLEFGEIFKEIDFPTIDIPDPKELLEDGKDAISSLIASKLPEATKVVGDIISEITGAPKKIGDAIGDFFGKLDIDSVSTVSKRQASNPLDKLGNIVNEIDALRGCLSAAMATNPLFQVAKCATSIAGVVGFPVARVLRIRGLVAGVGGKVKVLQELAKGAREGGDVKGILKAVLDIVEEMSGVAGLIKDCKFLLD